jgi:hypothetical protein
MRLARTLVEAPGRGFCCGPVDVEDCDPGSFGREAAGSCKTDSTR